MISFIPTVHDDALLYQASYTPALIFASVAIAIFSSYVALSISRAAPTASRQDQWIWSGVNALTLGSGIWAMHFIGMLALNLPCAVTYSPAITFFSILPGVLCSGVALHLAADKQCSFGRLLLASLILGIGIGTLHYVGMTAMRFDGLVQYEPKLLVLSIAIALLLSFAALFAKTRRDLTSRVQRALVAGIMGCAVSGVHYTAMASAHYVPGNGVQGSENLISPDLLAIAVVTATVLMTLLLAALSSASRNRTMATQLRKLSVAVEQSPNSIMITDLAAHVIYANAAFTVQTGYQQDEILGKNPRILQSGKTPRTTYDDVWAHLRAGEVWKGELINARKDGSEYIESALISPVRDDRGHVTNYLAIKDDITEQKKVEERVQNLVHFDQLTGLPNRLLLKDHFHFALNLAERNRDYLSVLFLDLDNFKGINDALGHHVGDRLLMEMARRLKQALREIDTLARLGGDEFVVILPGTDAIGAAHVAQTLLEVVALPCPIDEHELSTTTSIGISIYPNDGVDMETLSKNADAAMYRVKQEGHGDYLFFAQTMQADIARNLQLGSALRHAVARNQLTLHYQPQISLREGRIVGVEALLRWQHPELGTVSPGEFIPLAEDTGQIVAIGEWVLRTAVRQMKAWLDAGLPPMLMAVNLSALQFRQANLLAMVSAILSEADLPASFLELELTEAVAMRDPAAAVALMDQLHERGIRMSIDDFGTGYSSLSYLKRFKVYKLKIDQSFVRDLLDDPEDRAIVTAIISMAHSMGMQTIAEGVETGAQLEFLRQQGCDEVQGYYFSKPVAAPQLEAFVRGGLDGLNLLQNT